MDVDFCLYSAKGAAQRFLLNHFSVKFCNHDAFWVDLTKIDGDDLVRGQGGTILTYLWLSHAGISQAAQDVNKRRRQTSKLCFPVEINQSG